MPPKLTPEQKRERLIAKKEYFRQYYATHRAQQIEASRLWRQNNPDKCAQQNAKKALTPLTPEQKERARLATRRYRESHPEAEAARLESFNTFRRALYQSDEQYRTARKNASKASPPITQRVRRAWLKKLVFDHYGRICACCGETEEIFLTIGHINGDGAEHRKRVSKSARSGNAAVYLDLIRRGFPDDIRIECYNCNCGAFRNGGVCPHVRAKLTSVAPHIDASTDLLPCAPEVPTTAPGLVN